MSLEESVIFLAQGAALKAVRQRRLSPLAMCYQLAQGGQVRQLALLPDARGTLLGIGDRDYVPGPNAGEGGFVSSLLWEIRRQGYSGVFADFEHHTAPQAHWLRQLEAALAAEGLPLYAPIAYAGELDSAVLVLPCFVSGGSVAELLEEQIQRHGPERLAVDLTPQCRRFCLGTPSTGGEEISRPAREELRQQYRCSVFYSREMLCKYFTFMDESGQGHFVLFDDMSTLEAKLHQAQRLGIQRGFLAFEDFLALEREAQSP